MEGLWFQFIADILEVSVGRCGRPGEISGADFLKALSDRLQCDQIATHTSDVAVFGAIYYSRALFPLHTVGVHCLRIFVVDSHAVGHALVVLLACLDSSQCYEVSGECGLMMELIP